MTATMTLQAYKNKPGRYEQDSLNITQNERTWAAFNTLNPYCVYSKPQKSYITRIERLYIPKLQCTNKE